MLSVPNRPLKILVVGSGGREHALCWKLAQSSLVGQIFCAPGNGGTAVEHKTKNVNMDIRDFPGLAEFCKNEKIDLTVVGPENILAEGMVNYFTAKQLRIFGPTKEAARLEWSKSYAKEFMKRHNLPTAKFKICTNYDDALQIVAAESWTKIVKVDGLVFGKGVYVCDTADETNQALNEIFEQKKFGQEGNTIVLEERLIGEEISLFLLCDGKTFLPMAISQDNKRRFDGNKGPNTGGIGAISPPAVYAKYEKVINDTIIVPLLDGLKNEGIDYHGVLYLGLLLHQDTETGLIQPNILEFNSRFGDPEIEVVLPRLKSDLLPALWACTEGKLDEIKFAWKNEACCCVVAVHKDYPAGSSKGQLISLNKNGSPLNNDIIIFHAGTKMADSQLVTAGGRILAVTALAPDLQAAAKHVYDYLPNINFADMDYRRDIGRTKSEMPSRK